MTDFHSVDSAAGFPAEDRMLQLRLMQFPARIPADLTADASSLSQQIIGTKDFRMTDKSDPVKV